MDRSAIQSSPTPTTLSARAFFLAPRVLGDHGEVTEGQTRPPLGSVGASGRLVVGTRPGPSSSPARLRVHAHATPHVRVRTGWGAEQVERGRRGEQQRGDAPGEDPRTPGTARQAGLGRGQRAPGRTGQPDGQLALLRPRHRTGRGPRGTRPVRAGLAERLRRRGGRGRERMGAERGPRGRDGPAGGVLRPDSQPPVHPCAVDHQHTTTPFSSVPAVPAVFGVLVGPPRSRPDHANVAAPACQAVHVGPLARPGRGRAARASPFPPSRQVRCGCGTRGSPAERRPRRTRRPRAAR